MTACALSPLRSGASVQGVCLLHVQAVVRGECRHSDIAEAELPVQHVGRIKVMSSAKVTGTAIPRILNFKPSIKGPAVVAVVGQVPAAGAVTDGLTHEGVAEDFRTVQVLQLLDTVITDRLYGFQRFVTRVLTKRGRSPPRSFPATCGGRFRQASNTFSGVRYFESDRVIIRCAEDGSYRSFR